MAVLIGTNILFSFWRGDPKTKDILKLQPYINTVIWIEAIQESKSKADTCSVIVPDCAPHDATFTRRLEPMSTCAIGDDYATNINRGHVPDVWIAVTDFQQPRFQIHCWFAPADFVTKTPPIKLKRLSRCVSCQLAPVRVRIAYLKLTLRQICGVCVSLAPASGR